MNNNLKLSLAIALLILENLALWYLANFYYQFRAQQEIAESKTGQAEVCKNIAISESLKSVLERMGDFKPYISVLPSGDMELNYGSEQSKGFAVGAGVAFIFDQNYKLTHKACDRAWEPQAPNF